MAYFKIDNVKFSGVAAAVPQNTLYTKEYELFSPIECDKFIDSVGVKERRVVDVDTCTSD